MADKKTAAPKRAEGEYLLYKNRPLVREGNMICYGCVEDEFILQLMIMSTKEYKGKNVPEKILIQIVKTDTGLSSTERIVKQDMKIGFADSLELGIIWLERLLSR